MATRTGKALSPATCSSTSSDEEEDMSRFAGVAVTASYFAPSRPNAGTSKNNNSSTHTGPRQGQGNGVTANRAHNGAVGGSGAVSHRPSVRQRVEEEWRGVGDTEFQGLHAHLAKLLHRRLHRDLLEGAEDSDSDALVADADADAVADGSGSGGGGGGDCEGDDGTSHCTPGQDVATLFLLKSSTTPVLVTSADQMDSQGEPLRKKQRPLLPCERKSHQSSDSEEEEWTKCCAVAADFVPVTYRPPESKRMVMKQKKMGTPSGDRGVKCPPQQQRKTRR